ncbi:MAG: dienelactone hydrolase family protein [Candidatus Omnitrophota bacterium]|nr:dienelactone hydrolase family protein [Candidatus Omnitrophota bacterium]
MKILSALILFAVIVMPSVHAQIQAYDVEYSAGGDIPLRGYLVYDKDLTEPTPGILVVHEWWGQNDYARKRAWMLAELGYTALAIDMYGEGKVATHPKDAGAFAGEAKANMDVAQARFKAALDVLKNYKGTDPDKIAAIGYCFGGGIVLEMARRGMDIAGVVSFHGSLATENPAVPGAVKAKVLVLHGADDKFIPPAQVEAFKKEMEDAGVDYRFISYEGATHSFTNPAADELAREFELDVAYNPQADHESWQALQDFFESLF